MLFPRVSRRYAPAAGDMTLVQRLVSVRGAPELAPFTYMLQLLKEVDSGPVDRRMRELLDHLWSVDGDHERTVEVDMGSPLMSGPFMSVCAAVPAIIVELVAVLLSGNKLRLEAGPTSNRNMPKCLKTRLTVYRKPSLRMSWWPFYRKSLLCWLLMLTLYRGSPALFTLHSASVMRTHVTFPRQSAYTSVLRTLDS